MVWFGNATWPPFYGFEQQRGGGSDVMRKGCTQHFKSTVRYEFSIVKERYVLSPGLWKLVFAKSR